MGSFIRKLFGHFGTKKDDHGHTRHAHRAKGAGGFGMKMAVPVETPVHAPVVAQTYGNGGVQGLKWYSEKLLVDKDGDIAQEFLSEVIPENTETQGMERHTGLEAVAETRPAVLKGPVCTQNGNVHQYVESPDGHCWA